MTAKPVYLPKFMTVTFAWSARACLVHAKVEPYMLKNEGHVLAQWDNISTDPTENVVCYKRQERRDEQGDCYNSVKQLDQHLHNDWRKELGIPDQYSSFCNQHTRMLEELKSMWNGHLWSIQAVQHQNQLDETQPAHPLLSLPCRRKDQKVRKTRNPSNARNGRYRACANGVSLTYSICPQERQNSPLLRRFSEFEHIDDPGLVPDTAYGQMYELFWRCSDIFDGRWQKRIPASGISD